MLLFSLLLSLQVLTQEEWTVVKGKITNTSNEPLSGASIVLPGTGTGTVTNSAGIFALKIPSSKSGDTLHISHLGYHTAFVPVKPLRYITCALQASALSLKEVVVQAEDPVQIIRQAIQRIPDNYFDEYVTSGFYRTATRKEQAYIQLSEAVFDIYNGRKNQLRLKKMRTISDERATHGIELASKPKHLFKYDFVRHMPESDIFGRGGLRDHRFVLKGIVDHRGEEAYRITFDQRDGLKKALYKGTVYISTSSLAFLSLEYGYSPKGITYARYGDAPTRALMKLLDIDIDLLKDDNRMVYRKSGGKWVLSDAMNNTVFGFKSRRNHYNFRADARLDYIVTDVDTLQRESFAAKEVLGANKFIEQQEADTAAGFWQDYTILLPDFDVEAAAKKIRVANEGYSIKNKVQAMARKLPRDPSLRIDSMLAWYHREGQFNGMALVRHKGRVILHKSYGYANIEKQLKADSNTVYRIGSLSKSFTAIIIQQLAGKGKFRLEDSIGTYLPGYAHGNLTIDQLLSHRSGIPNYTANTDYLAKIFSKPFTLREMATQFCSDSLEFTPGTDFSYSNSGYLVLAWLAETVTGESFEKLLQDRICKPAGMQFTHLGEPGEHAATGYLYGKPEPAYYPGNVAGSGGISSTSSDLRKWDEALRNNLLLPREAFEELLQPRAAYTDWEADYGYGWMIDKYMFDASRHHKITYHPGTDLGFYSMFVRQEDADNAIILLNNTGDFPRFEMTDLILGWLN
jgi:CubicO group peptidase (beta-lactamase class C family)